MNKLSIISLFLLFCISSVYAQMIVGGAGAGGGTNPPRVHPGIIIQENGDISDDAINDGGSDVDKCKRIIELESQLISKLGYDRKLVENLVDLYLNATIIDFFSHFNGPVLNTGFICHALYRVVDKEVLEDEIQAIVLEIVEQPSFDDYLKFLLRYRSVDQQFFEEIKKFYEKMSQPKPK